MLLLLLGRIYSAGRGGREAGFPDGIAELIVTIITLRVFLSGVGDLKVSEISKMAAKCTYFKYRAAAIRGF